MANLPRTAALDSASVCDNIGRVLNDVTQQHLPAALEHARNGYQQLTAEHIPQVMDHASKFANEMKSQLETMTEETYKRAKEEDYFSQAKQWIVDNPGKTTAFAGGIGIVACPGFIMSPILTQLGFGSGMIAPGRSS
jgi:ElaB/YqjD/DUF883 family membrane-anchored ribosome-binding protein